MRQAIASVLGRAAAVFGGYVPPPVAAPAPVVSIAGGRAQRRRKRSSPQPHAQTRWLQQDVETAQRRAANGDMSLAGKLYRSLWRDGVFSGLMGTRTGGLVRLPKRYEGDDAAIGYLDGCDGEPGKFETHFPDAELALFDADGIVCGVGVAEFLDTPDGPVFCRLDPEFLRYRWYEDRWYYQSVDGLEPITPGDGRWVLHTPGGRYEPWNNGLLWSTGRAYISKEHAFFYRENWNAKLSHAARAATAPAGATEKQRRGFLESIIAWGVNTVFELPIGWDVKIIESNGRGYESYKETIVDANQELMVAIAGQIVTVTGGAGFANANIHATIRSDLIQGDGKATAGTLVTQALPWVLREKVGNVRATVAWDTRPPAMRKEEAEALSAASKAIDDLAKTLTARGIELDVRALLSRFAIPLIASRVPEIGVAPAAEPVAEPVAVDPEPTVEAEPEIDPVAALAEKMTAAGVDRCEHGRSNRCPLCGVERVRDFDVDENGNTTWRIAWRPIAQLEVAA